jgi:hypothetical protein
VGFTVHGGSMNLPTSVEERVKVYE